MARRRAGRHARVTRRFTPRRWLPFLMLVAVIGAAVYVTETAEPPVLRDVAVTSPETMMPVAAVPRPVSSTWFCAGGSALGAGERADLSVVIANSADRGATATVTVFGEEGRPRAETVEVPAAGRVRVRARDVHAGKWAAATVEVFGGRATVERQVDGPDGFELSPCSAAAASTWYVPSGSTVRGALMQLALFNPFPDPTAVDISFATNEGPIAPRALRGLAIPARSLRVVTVENPSRRAEVAARISTRTGRIVVDRLQTYDGSGDAVTGSGPAALATEAPRGLASAPALAKPATRWFFPDVRIVDGGRTQVALLNPGRERTQVELTVGFDDPRRYQPIAPITVTIDAGDQALVDLTDRVEFMGGMELTLRAESTTDVGVVAELVWFTGERDSQPEPTEGDPDAEVVPEEPDDDRVPEQDPDAPTTTLDPDTRDEAPSSQSGGFTVYAPGFAVTAGSPVASRSWFLAGRGANEAVTSQVVVANPSEVAVSVKVRELVGGRSRSVPGATVTVPARGRVTLDLEDTDPGSALIISAESGVVVGRTQWATTGRGISTDLATPFPDQVVTLPPL